MNELCSAVESLQVKIDRGINTSMTSNQAEYVDYALQKQIAHVF